MMGYTLNSKYVTLPASGNAAHLGTQGRSQDSYRAWRMARDANYLRAARSTQVIASGNHNSDYGTYASVTSDAWAINAASGYLLRHRGRALIWPPWHSVDLHLYFRAAASGGDGAVKLWACEEPITDDLDDVGRSSSEETTVFVGASFSNSYSIAVTDCPVGPDGMIYFYIGLNDIDKFGSWCLFRRAISV